MIETYASARLSFLLISKEAKLKLEPASAVGKADRHRLGVRRERL